jgi:hypothetical protein
VVLKVGYVPVEALNEPQVLAGAQLQFTPALFGSPLTVAVMVAVAPGTRVDGGAVLTVTVIPEAALIVIAGVLALFVVSVTEVAVMTTVLVGTELGAV